MNVLKPVIGEKFGCYEVISDEVHKVKDPNREHYRGFYLVKCKCGREQLVRSDILKSGQATQCRYCSNKVNYDRNVELGKVAHKGYSVKHQGIGELSKTLVLNYKYSAANRGLEWSEDMTVEYLWSLFEEQQGKCALSGLEITLNKGKNVPMQTNQRNMDYKGWTGSLDRKDSTKGYIVGNVQWVHRNINIMKNSYSEAYFLELCTLVVNNHLNKNITYEQQLVSND